MFTNGTSLRGSDTIAVVDLAVAVGVDIEVDISRPDCVQHDGHSDRPRTSEPELGIAPTAASIANFLGQVLRLLAAQEQRTERRMLERISGRR